MPFAPLRGFRDYVPPEAGARSELMRRMRASARRCGFSELETPSVEPLDLYKVKSGEEITREVWAFQDKGGRDVALAPETTPSLARIYAERAKSEPLPVKWFTVQKLWRYEEPQAGRTREFSQLNFDILGVAGVEAEVETLASAALALDEAGAAGLYAFRINDRPLAEGLGRHFGASDVAAYFRTVDRYRKSSAKEFLAGLESAGIPAGRTGELAALFGSVGAGVLPADLPAFFDRIEALGLEEGARAGVARIRATVRARWDRGPRRLRSDRGPGPRVLHEHGLRGIREGCEPAGPVRRGPVRPTDRAVRRAGHSGLRARDRGPDARAPVEGARPLAGRRTRPRHVRGHGIDGVPAGCDPPRPGAPARGGLGGYRSIGPLDVPAAQGGGAPACPPRSDPRAAGGISWCGRGA